MSHPVDSFTGIVHPDVKTWLAGLGGDDDPLIARMEAHAAEHGFPLVGRQSGLLLELLTRSIGGRRVFEMGSGWGFSAFFFARAIGAEGTVIGTEKDTWELESHERLFAGHPLKERIRLIQGDAFAVLDDQDGLFDVIFIDIDKASYVKALHAAIERVRPGGLILTDNAIWGGRVARPLEDGDTSTAGVLAYAQAIHDHPRLQSTILPVGDGLAMSLVLPG